MPLALESAETQRLPVSGAEVVALPDGTHALSIATPEGCFAARSLAVPGSEAGALLVGDSRTQPTLLALGHRLASAGIHALAVSAPATADPTPALRGACAFLGRSGARRLALVAAGEPTAVGLERAAALGCTSVALLSPSPRVDPRHVERLRGRPLYVFAPAGDSTAAALAGTGYLWLRDVAMGPASPDLSETLGDLAALLVPRLCADLQLLPDAGKGESGR